MSFLSSLKSKTFFLTITFTAVIYLCASITVCGQSLREMEKQNFGAIDPLLFEVRDQGRKFVDSSTSIVTNSLNKNENVVQMSGELDPALNAAIDASPGNARSMALQSDGKILIGGYFKTLNGMNFKSIVRLNTDNSIDQTFNTSINGTVFAIAIQPDGKIIICGSFTVINGTNQSRIARLNTDGSLDTTFNTGIGANSAVYDIAIQPDGKILLGGNFVAIGTTLNFYVARLNADGSLDTTFSSALPSSSPFGPQTTVYSLALQPDGKIVLGGSIILSTSPTLTTTPITRLNANGTFDSSFNPGSSSTSNNSVNKVVLQQDGKILAGGLFTNINGVLRRFIARLNADGSVDTSFDTGMGASSTVYSVFLQPDGKILIGGAFTMINGVERSRIARLNSNGSVDNTFVPNITTFGTIYSVISGADGRVLSGGSFAQTTTTNRDTLSVFNSDGTVDTSVNFNTTGAGGIRAVAIQPDGKILVGGTFNRINGVARNRLARLNPDGTIDNTFSSILPALVTAIAIQPDGKILVGGAILLSGGTLPSIIRLNSDGSLDSSFNQTTIPGSIGTCVALALQSDGKILASQILASTSGVSSNYFSRFNADGSHDSTFTPGFSGSIESFVPLPDGKVLIGGPFYIRYVGSGQEPDSYYGVLRLNADGSHDRSFRAGLFSDITTQYFTSVYTLVLQADGRILVGGNLFTSNGASPVGIARLNADGTIDESFQRHTIASTTESARVEDLQLLPNGKLVIGGRFNSLGTTALNNVARLNTNGSVDNTFNTGTDNAVYDIALQSDGKLIMGGDFDTVNGTARSSLARLLNEPITPRRTSFDFDGDGKTDISIFRPSLGQWWYQRSSDGQVPAAQFGTGTDKLVPADYTGDGKTDIAYWQPSTGAWFVLRSENNTYYSFPFGANGDIPVPADYDGDGQADAAVFRPSNSTWYINKSTGGITIQQFGASDDVPVVADYDGDGKSDIAIFRPGSAEWWIQRSSAGLFACQFGSSGDKPVQGDYTGDGKADVAFWRPSTGEWFILRSENLSFFAAPFGAIGDIPTPGDYDGDGKFDFGVFRSSSNTWFVNRSTQGTLIQGFGVNGDIPVPSAYIP